MPRRSSPRRTGTAAALLWFLFVVFGSITSIRGAPALPDDDGAPLIGHASHHGHSPASRSQLPAPDDPLSDLTDALFSMLPVTTTALHRPDSEFVAASPRAPAISAGSDALRLLPHTTAPPAH